MSRENTQPLALSIGRVQALTVLDSGMVCQLLLSPTLIELVCTCSFQPIWSAAQDKSKFEPLTVFVSTGGFGLTVRCALASILAAKSMCTPELLVSSIHMPLVFIQ